MLEKLMYSFFLMFCASAAVVASGKSETALQEDYSHTLSFDRGKKIAAQTISFNVKEGKDCAHVAKYENGEIVTQIGGLAAITGSTSLNLSGEQVVTVYNNAGTASFKSVSKNWDVQGKNIVHHHEGFDVHTNKQKQFVVSH